MKIIKILTLGLALLTGCASPKTDYATSLPEIPKPREIRYCDNIKLNIENKVRYLINKNESEGEKDLINLSSYSDFEEAYIFVSDSTWIEVGFGENKDEHIYNNFHYSKRSVMIDSDLLKERGKINQRMTLYHTHIARNPERKEGYFYYPESNGAMFSVADIKNFLTETRNLHVFNPNLDYRYKVASRFGITECTLSDEGKKDILSMDEMRFNGFLDKISGESNDIKDYFIRRGDTTKPFSKEIFGGKMKIKFRPLNN